MVALVECSEVDEVETEADSEEAGVWIEVDLEEEDAEDLGAHLGLSWSKWEAEAAGVEDQEKWTRVNIVRSGETGPTRGRNLQSCIYYQIYFLNQKMF